MATKAAANPFARAVRTSYTSKPVPIPANFLAKPAHDGKPVTAKHINWEKSVLPQNKGCYAVVLDNVLSPSECAEMLRLVEASVPEGEEVWRPAMVNIGNGWEVLQPDYRNSDRIIWDQQEVVDRLWERCASAPGIRAELETLEERSRRGVSRWKFDRFNKRMRFLKYQGGQFFRPHCDGPYGETTEEGKVLRTHYTVHLFLNDSVATAGEEAELVGGATSFLSSDEEHKMDVDPKAGRVLIFQHKDLYHSGDDVVKGTKYTMRTDILYELQRD